MPPPRPEMELAGFYQRQGLAMAADPALVGLKQTGCHAALPSEIAGTGALLAAQREVLSESKCVVGKTP